MRQPLLNKNQQKEVIIKRLEGNSIMHLAIEFNVSVKTIQRIIKGIHLRTNNKRVVLDSAEVIEKYKELNKISEVAKFFKVSESTIKEVLKKANFKWDSSVTGRFHFFNENFFATIDTEEKAYWLGFIFADGSIHKNGNRINITLKENDLIHLEKFAKEINYKGKIANVITTKACSLTLYSKKMSSDLVKLGCMSDKSSKIVFPDTDIVPLYLQSHFMRGYFDGDGCLTSSKRPTFSIVSNYVFIEKFQELLINELNISKTKLYKHKGQNTYSLIYGGVKMIKKIVQYLYKDSNIFLDRKKEVCKKWKFIS